MRTEVESSGAGPPLCRLRKFAAAPGMQGPSATGPDPVSGTILPAGRGRERSCSAGRGGGIRLLVWCYVCIAAWHWTRLPSGWQAGPSNKLVSSDRNYTEILTGLQVRPQLSQDLNPGLPALTPAPHPLRLERLCPFTSVCATFPSWRKGACSRAQTSS